jgi:hypothetical protein
MTTFSNLIAYLQKLGTGEVEHTEGTYLGHVAGLYRDLKAWDCPEDVCVAGMFHSIYGTEIFQSFSLPLEKRSEVRELIGERAEYLAYLNSAIDYASFDGLIERGGRPSIMRDRFTGGEIEMSPEDFDDLCRIHLCDRLEQALRSQDWDFRPQTFRRLAEQLGGVAKRAYDRVYASQAATG